MLDVASLLQPISSATPAGIDLRRAQMNDHPLDKVKKERFQEDPLTLPAGTEPRKVNWQAVLEGCRVVLTKHSKDLEAAAYLTEALTRVEGLSGLDRGIEIMTGLLHTFWPTLHPGAPSADSPEVMAELRTKWLTWIGGANDLQNALRTVPVGVVSDEGRAMTFGDMLDARRVQKAYQENPTEYSRLVEAKLTTPEAWSAAVVKAPAPQLEAIAAAAQACLERLQGLGALCETLFPPDATPSLRRLAELLELLAQELRSPGVQGGAAAQAPTDAGGGSDGGGGTAGQRGGAVGAPGTIASRDDALRALQAVARYLRQAEPHSPVSYMLDRCARWLGMTFDQLMQDLMKDPAVLEGMREKLGIQPPPQG